MSLAAKVRRAPLRIVTGAYIVNSGVGKLSADDQTAQQLHGMASGTYGFLGKVDPKLFAKGLGAGEIALGAVVVAPFVSPVVAGLGLAGFSGAMLNMWWNTPGMHEEGSPRPTVAGTAIAKDVWLLGIGTGLVADGILSPAHDKKVQVAAAVQEKRNRKGRRKAKKAAKKTRNEAAAHAIEIARSTQADLNKRAAKALKTAQKTDAAKRARQASERAAKRLGEAKDEYAPVVADKAKQARSAAADLYDEYAPVVADKAKQARSAAADLYDEYAPVAVDKAKQARSAAAGLRDEVSSAAAGKVKQSRRSARRTAKRAKKQVKKAKR